MQKEWRLKVTDIKVTHITHTSLFEEILKILLTKKYTDVINYIVETENK